MSETHPSTRDHYEPERYEICIQGHLDHQWADWFGGLSIKLEENGNTLLSGPIVDQSALYGLLKKVRDLGMALVSVNPVKPDQGDAPEVKP